MRELREFRAHHSELVAAGVAIAGVSRDSPASNRRWSERLRLPYPLLSDSDGFLGRELSLLRTLRFGPWTVELLRRATLLADADGVVARVWTEVHVRGHALEVLEAARGLGGPGRSAT